MKSHLFFHRAAIAALVCLTGLGAACSTARPIPAPGAPPLQYSAKYTHAVPNLLQGLQAGAWATANWTADFVDIEGPAKPDPTYRTRAKILWDDRNLYIGAEVSDPDVWATLTHRDEIVFHDNDFEVFIDPDGDTREYYEIEVNALQTVFDLYLHQTYRAGGPAVHAWDCAGLGVSTQVRGVINDPGQIDKGWLVQLTIPWSALQPPQSPDLSGRSGFGDAARAGAPPNPGETWRINFSRVQWRHNFELLGDDGKRLATMDAATRLRVKRPDRTQNSGNSADASPYSKVRDLPEDNWVWSPQWTVDMHLPQFWGRVTFTK